MEGEWDQFPHLAFVVAACLLLITWRIWAALPARVGGGFKPAPKVGSRHTMVVLGSGGHTGEMAALLADLALPHGELTFVTAASDSSSRRRILASTVSDALVRPGGLYGCHAASPPRRHGQGWCSGMVR